MISRRLFSTIAVQSEPMNIRIWRAITSTALFLSVAGAAASTHECHRMEYERNEALIGKNDWTARALSPEKYGKEEPYKYEFYVMDQHERQNNWFKRSIFARTVYRPPKIQNYIEWENED
jgi:hypothetical protein